MRFTGWGLCREMKKLKCSAACLLQQFNLRKQLLLKQGSSQIYRWCELFSAKIRKTFKVHGDYPLQLFLMQKCNWLEKECFGRENNFCSESVFYNKEEIALGRSYGKKKSPQTKCVTMLRNSFKIYNAQLIPRSYIRTFLKKYRKANYIWNLGARSRFLVL